MVFFYEEQQDYNVVRKSVRLSTISFLLFENTFTIENEDKAKKDAVAIRARMSGGFSFKKF